MFRLTFKPKFSLLFLALFQISCSALLNAQDAPLLFEPLEMTERVKLAEGLRLWKIAGNEQVPNAFCMAVHDSGDLIVSGPGYFRRLQISPGGLTAVTELPHPPARGAQGLWCAGDDLLFVGGPGLCRLTKVLADDHDGSVTKPEVLLEIETGKEHQAHAIRQGPDGWWYLICGNDTDCSPDLFADHASPVKDPHAGFLLRISLDFSRRQVFADGFRNAYDFDFGPDGEIYVYDSDGERDVSLPWYRPTRVFRVAAGDNAGWVNHSWKRPSYYYDMPVQVAALGRGSPTGVCYSNRHQLGLSWVSSLFVGDWTFGRIVAIPVGNPKHPPTNLLSSKGQFGFAATDLVIGADGLLYVTIGGRGTGGGLFRIEPAEYEASSHGRRHAATNRSAMPDSRTGQYRGALGSDRRAQPNIPKPPIPNVENIDAEQRWRAIQTALQKDTCDIDQIRQCQLLLGGCGGSNGMMAGYTAKHPLPLNRENRRVLLQTGNALLQRWQSANNTEQPIDELLRLLAMLRLPSEAIGNRILTMLVANDDPVRGIHLLNCFSLIGQSVSVQQAQQIRQFLCSLKQQIGSRGWNIDRNWEPRMTELVSRLAKYRTIREQITAATNFGSNDTLYLAEALTNISQERTAAGLQSEIASAIHNWCRQHPDEMSARHVLLIQNHPHTAELLRKILAERPQLLDVAVKLLSERPTESDRASFVRGLDSDRLETIKRAAIGLRRLLNRGARELTFKEASVAVGAWARLQDDGPGKSVGNQLMLLIKSSFGTEARFTGADALQAGHFLEKHFDKPLQQIRLGTVNVDHWMDATEWSPGDAERGRSVFVKCQCASCHQAGSDRTIKASAGAALGPSLEGVSLRFSKRDLFHAILNPDDHIADRYRSVIVLGVDDEIYVGLEIYRSADGITMLLNNGSTARINAEQIHEITDSKKSLMPAGLLDNTTSKQRSDLLAYLRSL